MEREAAYGQVWKFPNGVPCLILRDPNSKKIRLVALHTTPRTLAVEPVFTQLGDIQKRMTFVAKTLQEFLAVGMLRALAEEE